jgi:hypothetical protein
MEHTRPSLTLSPSGFPAPWILRHVVSPTMLLFQDAHVLFNGGRPDGSGKDRIDRDAMRTQRF